MSGAPPATPPVEDQRLVHCELVQRFYRDKVDATDVENFNKFGARFTRFTAFPPIVRKRIDTTIQLMRESLDEFRPNCTIATAVLETLTRWALKIAVLPGRDWT